MSHISLKKISQQYAHTAGKDKKPSIFSVLNNVSFDIKEGEFVTIFGPNGSGKSTLFRIISGFEQPFSGDVLVAGKRPRDVRIGFVFQDYRSSMLPWRNVLGNVALALEARGIPKKDIEKKAAEYLARVRMADYAEKDFWQLSGGQSQAVAIARALAYEPEVLLLDEPFSALDFEVTLHMMEMLLAVWSESKLTTLFISHQVEEAVFLADRVIVLSSRPGRIKEVIPVPLARPRTLAMLESPEFFVTRNKVLEVFKETLAEKSL